MTELVRLIGEPQVVITTYEVEVTAHEMSVIQHGKFVNRDQSLEYKLRCHVPLIDVSTVYVGEDMGYVRYSIAKGYDTPERHETIAKVIVAYIEKHEKEWMYGQA